MTNPEKPRVLVTDKIARDGLQLLEPFAQVDERIGIDPAELVKIIGEYDALVVRSETKVTAAVLAAAEKMRVVARAGVGVDNIDVPAATNRGIIVVNSPTGNVGAAAEHTVAMLMSMARRIPDAVSSMREGKWERSRFVGVELRNKTLGIVGLGKVGFGVARSVMGMGMHVIATDPYTSPELARQAGIEFTDLESVLKKADFLTVHTPMTPTTKNMISTQQFAMMPQGARVLNVARGGVVDEDALLAAIESGHIAGAALDVFTKEPPSEGSAAFKLVAHPNVIATPHLGASTEEAQVTVAVDVCEQVVEVLGGGVPRAAVNAPIILPEELAKLRPYLSLVEKMGMLYRQWYRKQSLKFVLTYNGDIAEGDSFPLRVAFVKGLLRDISEERVNLVNANLVAKQRGLEIEERKLNSVQQYANLVTVHAEVDGTEQVLAGTVTWDEDRIVRLDRYETNFVPSGHILFCKNIDRPGMIGKVGTVLGSTGTNINNMNVGPLTTGKGPTGEALMILSVDRQSTPEAIAAIAATDGIFEVVAVEL